ncbi:sentrin-specific protease 8 [Lepeophtheirus salmonis]|uniref:sentrin-specific protease 8 n=1 Tax=Lepeophtheirus salmonis TaxID=72036 RepID=UPI003AF3F1C6
MGDPVVISYGDALLRHSDVQLLKPQKWLNDQIIGFYFEYLHQNHNYGSEKICFISPEVSQFLKMGGSEEIALFLEPRDLLNKEVIALAINNAQDPSSPGGSHCNFSSNSSTVTKFSFVNVPVPRQTNGYDCGIHVLCHAEHSLHHFIIYGSPDGLQPLEESIIKKKRKEILELVNNLSKTL